MSVKTSALLAACLVLLPYQTASASDANSITPVENEAYQINWRALETLNYSQSRVDRRDSERQTELSFKLSPGKFDFSMAGAFGLGGVFSNPALEVSSYRTGKYHLQESVPELHSGLSYSADLRIDQEFEELADTAYVSSSQLGVSYGRLGQVWYSGVDVKFGQFSYDSPIRQSSEVLSFDITTGRRLEFTGIGSSDPMWLLSLKGNFDMQHATEDTQTGDRSDWYLNPSLFWQNPGFTFSAQLELPVDSDLLKDLEEPDYRLRAVFEKNFK